MSSVQEIEQALPKLSRAEIEEIRAWIDDYLEDQLQLKDKAKAELDQSRKELKMPMDKLIADTWEKLGPAPELDYDQV